MFTERKNSEKPASHPELDLSSEAGQAAIGLLLAFSLLIIAGLALSIDVGNLWFHRQATQSAADAACQAGAMDLLATSGGVKLNSMGFTPGTGGDCASSSAATMCAYAKFNGYNGVGPQPATNTNSGWNTVSWTFPSSVPGTTAPPASMTATPYLKVSVVESVKTFFMGLFTPTHYQKVTATSTCGLAQIKAAAPIVVLHPSMAGSLNYTGGAILKIVGGPQRSLQVNSTSSTAVICSPSGYVNTSQGGPSATGADLGVVGAEAQSQNGCAGDSHLGFYGGTTGNWRSSVLPVSDPFSAVPAPAKPANAPAPKWVQYRVDGCPDTRNNVYVSASLPNESCLEFFPGYYPSGMNVASLMNNYSTAIFAPGVYYLNGSLTAGNSVTLRMAKPAGSQRTDGVMFYFLTGSLNISGCSGCSNSSVDNVNATDLTCDGTAPPASLGMPSTVSGNVLVAPCAQNGTYWDLAGDNPADSRGTPGSRGILVFSDHSNAAATPTFAGSGALNFSGTLYFHSSTYGDVLSLSGGTGAGNFIMGNIIADQIKLTGSGAIGMQLNPTPSTYMLKATTFQ